MVFFSSKLPPASSIFAVYASISAFIMLIQSIFNQFVPHQVQNYVWKLAQSYLKRSSTKATFIVDEWHGMSSNQVYSAAETYLSTKIRRNIERLKIGKNHRDRSVSIKFADCGRVTDSYQGVEIEWRFAYEKETASSSMNEDTGHVRLQSEKRYYELCFDKWHMDMVLDSYVPFVLETADLMRAEKKVVRLHTLGGRYQYSPSIAWDSIGLEHPSTFETLAMEPMLKKSIIDDLDKFVRRKDFYRKVGRAWKRGYLLYGPPGTGKSSLIGAIANYLKFDIYDLDLTIIKRDSDLRNLLLKTANRSILVIEDIDCTVEIPNRKGRQGRSNVGANPHPPNQQFTLSGLLNFIDGLWSSCSDERIIIFTTNHKDKLDPALLRPGRMDMHIHMSYLTPNAFKILASTYLSIQDQDQHPLFGEIEDLIETMNVTPADVAEELMKSDDADTSLGELLNFLKCKKNAGNDPLKDEVIDDHNNDNDGDGGDGDHDHSDYGDDVIDAGSGDKFYDDDDYCDYGGGGVCI